ncbi:MAG: ATP-dependent DNA ligase, partial [Ilumatobacter sp.]|nr:ATP-dependent DNA ligase [Ilumatobacter sp.]
MLFVDVATTTERVAATSKRSEKVAALAELLARAAPEEIEPTVSFAVGEAPQGRIGVGWATMRDVEAAPATVPSLAVLDVASGIDELAAIRGGGSVAARRKVLAALLGRATTSEQRLIRAIVGGELRQGALDGVMAAAVAKAAAVKVGEVQRAAMFAGSLPAAARAALTDGSHGLAAIELTPLRPVQPMLASTAPDIGTAIDEAGESAVEWKLDGARVQVHRAGAAVRIFTRNLNDVTDRLGGVVELVTSLPGGDLVLDGEALGVADDGSPRPFQDTMGDFGAGVDEVNPARGSVLQAFFFDVLHHGRPVVDEPLSVRRDLLAELVPEQHRLPSIVTADREMAQRCFDEAIEAGHEGVMVKQIGSAYEAGRRGGAWRKVKPVHTFDLVVLAAEWG